MKPINIIKAIKSFNIAEEILKRKDWVKYKTIPEWHGRILEGNIIVGNPGKEFNEVTNKHVNAYLFEKTEPPPDIAGAIMNIADDYLNDREIIMRSGDYIAIQNHIGANNTK